MLRDTTSWCLRTQVRLALGPPLGNRTQNARWDAHTLSHLGVARVSSPRISIGPTLLSLLSLFESPSPPGRVSLRRRRANLNLNLHWHRSESTRVTIVCVECLFLRHRKVGLWSLEGGTFPLSR